MKVTRPHLPTMLILTIFILFFSSCAKDNDLFLEAVLDEEEIIINEVESPEEGQSDNETEGENVALPDSDYDFTNTNKIVGIYNPSSAEEISDPQYANFKAVITESFDCTNCQFAPNQTIEPAGGIIRGSGIDLNNAYIENTFKQGFSLGSQSWYSKLKYFLVHI